MRAEKIVSQGKIGRRARLRAEKIVSRVQLRWTEARECRKNRVSGVVRGTLSPHFLFWPK